MKKIARNQPGGILSRNKGGRKTSKGKESAFARYVHSLSAAETEALSAFFREYDQHNFLSGKEKALMCRDFENAILTYASLGVSLEVALKRLGIENLGGFYARPSLRWFALDDAAKVYPLFMEHGSMAVFRLSVYLKEAVIPEILQMALTFTIKRFPSFATTVKKGFFWHYLNASKRRYSIDAEECLPCRPLAIARSGSQSFRVIYYHNRISAEFFHILTDGYGGMVFLRTLTAEYFRLLGIDSPKNDDTFDINDVPSPDELANDFARVPTAKKSSGFVDKPAVQMSGRLSAQKPCRVLHFKLEAAALKKAAANYNATITAYLLALILIACKNATDETTGSLNIQVPVNIRKFYSSHTLRNFSMYCGIKLPLTQIGDVRSIAGEISRQLADKTSQKAMDEMISATERLVGLLRYIPLAVKSPAAKMVNGVMSNKIFSNTLSNLGKVELPPELAEHVLSMDFVLGSPAPNRACCALVTCGSTATLSITKATADPSFEEKLYELLLSDDVALTVEGSELYEN